MKVSYSPAHNGSKEALRAGDAWFRQVVRLKYASRALIVARKTTVKVISANLLTKAKTAIAQAFTVNFATALA